MPPKFQKERNTKEQHRSKIKRKAIKRLTKLTNFIKL